MKVFKIVFALYLGIALTACSNTTLVKPTNQKNHYYANNFSHSNFSAYNKDSIKKALSSDHQLMLSLLNRPMPEDQRMMLAFAKRQENYFPDSTIVGIHIKGDKHSDKLLSQNTSIYADIIEQDINAVVMTAMPK